MAEKKKETAWNGESANPWLELFQEILGHKVVVAVFVVMGLCVGVFVAQWTRPVYEAFALIQVKSKGNSLSAMFGEVGALLGVGGSSAETEIQLMQSRRVLEEVADSLGLLYNAKSVSFMDRILHRDGRVDIRFLSFPDTSVIPVERRGMPWILIVDDSLNYTLFDDLEQRVLSCVVGELCRAPYQGDSVKISVAQMQSAAGKKFEVSKSLPIRAVKAISSNLSISEMGKKTGVLEITYQDYYMDRAVLVIDTLLGIYMRLNGEFGSSELKNSLEILEAQIPAARRTLDSLMQELNRYRERIGSADIAAETKIALESQTKLQQQIIQLEQMREERARLFDESHPTIVTLDKQIAALKREMSKANSQTKRLPETQQKIVTMTEEADFAKNLYSDLLKRTEQMRLLVENSSESVKLIDPAVVDPKPVKPKKKVIVLAFVFIGFCFSIGLISIRERFKGVSSPAQVFKSTGLRVYGCIEEGEKKAVDGLNALRLALDVKNLGEKRVIYCSGLLPHDGSSFVAGGLAKIFAQSGKRVLLIDADLQNGVLGERFHVKNSQGLVEILAGAATISSAICKTATENLDLLLPGRTLVSANGIFDSEKFSNFIRLMRDSYDVVILDAAPLDTSPEAVSAIKDVDVFVLTLECGRHSTDRVQGCASMLPSGSFPYKVVCLNRYSKENEKRSLKS